MKITKKDLEKSQVELNIELTLEEFKPYIKKGVNQVSKEVKIEGFRPGKADYEILKQKVGDMPILEAAARIAINDTIGKAIEQEIKDKQPVGQPQVDIVKLAPNNPLIYKAVLAVLPEVTLGEYKGLGIKEEKEKVSDEEVEKTLNQLREMRVKEVIVDREVKDTDKVLCNVEMFLDNVPIEGGQSKGVAVIIGKGYFVPGFGKKLIGAKKGEIKEFKLLYPKDFHQANLAGKNVEFKVKINEIYSRELPELNDEFASGFGVKKLDELKKSIKENLQKEKEQASKQKTEIAMLDKILEKTKIGDLPEMIINNEAQSMMEEMKTQIESQGGKFDEYLKSINKTYGDLLLEITPNAIKRLKTALMIREIAIKEKIEVSEKEIDEKIEELLKKYKGYEKVEERVKEPSYRAYLSNTIINQKVIDKLREWNIIK